MEQYKLPRELWIDIFSRLDYLTLKTGLSATCKLFNCLLSLPDANAAAGNGESAPHSIIRRSKLDFVLFRDDPHDGTGTELDVSHYTLHPFLVKHGFKLRDDLCTASRNPKECERGCERHVFTLAKTFYYYTDICSFAHTFTTLFSESRVSTEGSVFGDHFVSPSLQDLRIHLELSREFRQIPCTWRSVRDDTGPPTISTTVMNVSYCVHLFWSRQLKTLGRGSRQFFCPALADSAEELVSRMRLTGDDSPKYKVLAVDLQRMADDARR